MPYHRVPKRLASGLAALLLAAVTTLGAAGTASAAGPFGPAQQLSLCGGGFSADADAATNGVVSGFYVCAGPGNQEGALRYFERQGGTLTKVVSPYLGRVGAATQDGAGSTFVVFRQGTDLFLGRRTSAGVFDAPQLIGSGVTGYELDVDVVAYKGKWWAVWSRPIGGVLITRQLASAGNLIGKGPLQTQPLGKANNSQVAADFDGKVLVVAWTAWAGTLGGPHSVIKLASRTVSSAWTAKTVSPVNSDRPDVARSTNHTYLSWVESGSGPAVADDTSGSMSVDFLGLPVTSRPKLDVSGGEVTVGFNVSNPTVSPVAVAQRPAAGGWTTTWTPNGGLVDLWAVGGQAGVLHVPELGVVNIHTQS